MGELTRAGLVALFIATSCAPKEFVFVDAESGGLPGDWFECEKADCSVVDDDGVRFGSDFTFFEIEAVSDFAPNDTSARYCELQNEGGTYTFSGGLLTMSEGSKLADETTYQAEVDGDTLTITGTDGGGKQFVLRRVAPSRSLGECKGTGEACQQAAECKTSTCLLLSKVCEGAPPPPGP